MGGFDLDSPRMNDPDSKRGGKTWMLETYGSNKNDYDEETFMQNKFLPKLLEHSRKHSNLECNKPQFWMYSRDLDQLYEIVIVDAKNLAETLYIVCIRFPNEKII